MFRALMVQRICNFMQQSEDLVLQVLFCPVQFCALGIVDVRYLRFPKKRNLINLNIYKKALSLK